MVFLIFCDPFFGLRSYFTKDLSQEFFSSATQLQVDGTQGFQMIQLHHHQLNVEI